MVVIIIIWANGGDCESVTVNALPVGIAMGLGGNSNNKDGCAGASVVSGTSASSYGWDNILRMRYRLRQTAQQHIRLRVQMEMDVRYRDQQ